MIEPVKRPVGDEEYYSANAKLSYYKDVLNNALRGKNPSGYDKFFQTVGEARRKSLASVGEIVETFDFKEALAPQEIKEILKDDYDDYVSTITSIRDRGYADDKIKKLFGEKEMNEDVNNLMYGKRFATIPLVLSTAKTNIRDGKSETIEDIYSYDPKVKSVNKYTVRK